MSPRYRSIPPACCFVPSFVISGSLILLPTILASGFSIFIAVAAVAQISFFLFLNLSYLVDAIILVSATFNSCSASSWGPWSHTFLPSHLGVKSLSPSYSLTSLPTHRFTSEPHSHLYTTRLSFTSTRTTESPIDIHMDDRRDIGQRKRMSRLGK